MVYFFSGGTPPIVVHGHLDGILRLHWTGPRQGNSKCESRNELATAYIIGPQHSANKTSRTGPENMVSLIL